MQPFTTHTGIAVPLLEDDINTDQIAPVQAMRDLKPDYKKLLFMRARARRQQTRISCSTSRSSASPASW